MKDTERRTAAKDFAEYWKDRGYEKGESQPFWLSLLRDVLGVEAPEKFITFEEQVRLDHTSFIDGFISATHVLIEQKGRNKDLRKPIKQSDGTLLTPFQQAQRYSAVLPYSQRPRWIITCNFEEFLVYDMEKPNGEPEQIFVKDLAKEYYRLMFLVDTGDDNIRREMEVSIQAGNLVGILYDEILRQYHDPENEDSLKSLNKLIVRLVFCLYAEDAGIFGGHSKFHNYIKSFSASDMRKALIELFKILDTKPENRDPYEDEKLSSFPYVNGGLFADENIEIPQMNDKIRDLLLYNASEDFDWSDISPTIFGAVFESTLNPETRRSGGMHYTSIENIHKVIDPLFLDELRTELEEIKAIKVAKTRETKINAFREKLGSLTFFDPACGSGNFLTETYISLRRLENDAIEVITQGQMLLDVGNIIKVSIGQFYGIEINDFAVTVAKTALWIAESQMMKETEMIAHVNLDFLPLKSYANIVEGNALRVDWEAVVPKDKLNYIMGNPPFVGASMMTAEQKSDAVAIFGKMKLSNSIDYVGAWYHKAAELMQGTKIRAALVSTNSITQGEQVAPLWDKLVNQLNVEIDFAYRTFRWNSEAKDKAAVHCVIIGFSQYGIAKKKMLYFNESAVREVTNINPYLVDAPTVLVVSSAKPLSDIPTMYLGNKPADGGNLILSIMDYHRGKDVRHCGGDREYANGNGSLMRILPVCLYNYLIHAERDAAIDNIHSVSALTHAHERSCIACGIYDFIVQELISTPRKSSVKKALAKAKDYYIDAEKNKSYNRLYEPNFELTAEKEIKSSGYVVDTLEAAVWCLLNTNNYKECVLKAVNLGQDTDTVAAVAGGLAGILYGYKSIPSKWIDSLIKKDEILDMCSVFYDAVIAAKK